MTNASRAGVDHRGLHRGELTEHPLPRPQGADGSTSMIGKLIVATLLTAGMLLTGALNLCAQPARSDQAQTAAATPARISYISGDVSFWRPGAEEWTPARLNMPLAPGDTLYTGPNGKVEVQIGPRAFVRAASGTQIGLDNQEPGFVQFSVTAGRASVDLRELARAQIVELDTPNAAFTIERTGYYHADVTEDSTTFQTQRGGSATMTPAGGVAGTVAASLQVVVTGADAPRVDVGPTPGLTEWDRWNYQRTDELVNSPSARYGWTWLDDEPWGWAPYHHGRWVHASGVWGWAPGPIVTRPVYAPALVVFLGGPVRLSVGLPLAWAPLGGGEPIIPWWGRPSQVGRASWDGWGGPRVVNNVVVNNTTIVNTQNITVYRNVTGSSGVNAVVGVPADRFGRGDARPSRFSQADVQQLAPVRGQLAVKPVAASLAPSSGTAIRPPEKIHDRPVVATRPPRDFTPALRAEGLAAPAVVTPSAAPRLVPAPTKEAPPVRSAVAPSAPPGATPAIAVPIPARPDVKGDKAAERPQPATPPVVATPQPKRDASPAVAPAQPDTKRDKAAERPQPPTPPAVATPQPKRDASPAVTPVQPDAKRDKAAERPQPPPPPAVATPQPKVSAPAPVTAPVSQARRIEPNAPPAAGQPETHGRRPEQPAEPVAASPEPSQPRGARP